jgi:50S ribosomal subunit-associated GTPase HflX
METVKTILHEMSVPAERVVEVFNKVDLLPENRREALRRQFPRGLLISSREGEGLEELREEVTRRLSRYFLTLEILLEPPQHYLLAELRSRFLVLETVPWAEKLRVLVRMPEIAGNVFLKELKNRVHPPEIRRLTRE